MHWRNFNQDIWKLKNISRIRMKCATEDLKEFSRARRISILRINCPDSFHKLNHVHIAVVLMFFILFIVQKCDAWVLLNRWRRMWTLHLTVTFYVYTSNSIQALEYFFVALILKCFLVYLYLALADLYYTQDITYKFCFIICVFLFVWFVSEFQLKNLLLLCA